MHKVTQYKTGKASLYAQGALPPPDLAANFPAHFAAAGAPRADTAASLSKLVGGGPLALRAQLSGSIAPDLAPLCRQAALRPQAVRLWWPDQACVPQEGAPWLLLGLCKARLNEQRDVRARPAGPAVQIDGSCGQREPAAQRQTASGKAAWQLGTGQHVQPRCQQLRAVWRGGARALEGTQPEREPSSGLLAGLQPGVAPQRGSSRHSTAAQAAVTCRRLIQLCAGHRGAAASQHHRVGSGAAGRHDQARQPLGWRGLLSMLHPPLRRAG